jgi:hypothetical protein
VRHPTKMPRTRKPAKPSRKARGSLRSQQHTRKSGYLLTRREIGTRPLPGFDRSFRGIMDSRSRSTLARIAQERNRG